MDTALPCAISEKATEIQVPVISVTITEDQADIRREGRFTWTAGPSAVLITPVTPYLMDSTLWVEMAADNGNPSLGSIRCIRWLVPLEQHLSGHEPSVRNSAQNLLERIDLLHRDRKCLSLLKGALTASLAPTVKSIVEDVAFKGAEASHYEPVMNRILDASKEINQQDFSLLNRLVEVDSEVTELHREWLLRVARSTITSRMAAILVTFEAPFPGEGILRCGYQVPCAQWRPQHEASLTSDDRVMLSTRGIVWQNTGEDWKNIELTLSTARPSLGLAAPLPGEDLLRLREKTREERKTIRVEARDQIIQSTGVSAPGDLEPPLPADGGETQIYLVPERVDIPSNGRPVMIKLESFSMDASTALTSTPELDSHVFLISEVSNTRNRPILAGPATLLRGGSYVGCGTIDFTGPGETFHIWWGSEDLIRVERFVDEKIDEATLLHGRKIKRTVTLHIRNLSGEETGFTIKERIPVSELEQVRITLRKPPDSGTAPDRNGFLTIDVALAPRETRTIEYIYHIDMAIDVDFSDL